MGSTICDRGYYITKPWSVYQYGNFANANILLPMIDQIISPGISIVVCTHNSGEQLIPALHALANQSISMLEFEVIIVDNHNSPNINVQKVYQRFLERSCFEPNRLRYVHCCLDGLSHARNAGIAASKGEIICFIDDDATASPDWIETIAHAFHGHPNAGVIGGHILLKIPYPKPKILAPGFEIFWSQFVTNYSQYTDVDNWKDFPWGANWCVRRSAILAMGRFNENYGRGSLGRKYWGGEELVAALQIQKLGYKIAVEPKAIVLHNVDRSRYTFRHVWNTILADKLARYQMQKDGILEIPTRQYRTSIWERVRKPVQTVIDFLNRNKHPLLLFIQICAHLTLLGYKIFYNLTEFCPLSASRKKNRQ